MGGILVDGSGGDIRHACTPLLLGASGESGPDGHKCTFMREWQWSVRLLCIHVCARTKLIYTSYAFSFFNFKFFYINKKINDS